MKRETAYRMASGFVDSLVVLEKLTGVQKPYPNIKFETRQRKRSPDSFFGFVGEYTTAPSVPFGIRSNSCTILTNDPEPDSIQIEQMCDAVAGVYLAVSEIGKYSNLTSKYRIERGFPVKRITAREQEKMHPINVKGGKQHVSHVMGKHLVLGTYPGFIFEAFVSGYASEIAAIHRDNQKSRIPEELWESAEEILESGDPQIEKGFKMAETLGYLAGHSSGPKALRTILEIPPHNFHKFLNSIYGMRSGFV